MKVIDDALFDRLRAEAAKSPRRRGHVSWHDPAVDTVQRFFVHMLPGTYVRPHRHLLQRRFELSTVLDGSADLLLFGDDGALHTIVALGANAVTRGVELPCEAWHSYRVTGESLTMLEIKEGPYDAAADKTFAPWAPAELSAQAPAFVDWLQRARVGERWETR